MSRAPLSLADTWPFSDDRCDRAPILAAWTRATNVRRCDRGFKFRPLGIRQHSHLVSPPMPNEIRRVVISPSHEMRTGPTAFNLPVCSPPRPKLPHSLVQPNFDLCLHSPQV